MGYPKAVLFGFCIVAVAYNAMSLLMASLRSCHGEEKVENEVPTYYIHAALESSTVGMFIIIDEEYWKQFVDMPIVVLAKKVPELAANVDLRRYRKSKRGPKKKPTPKTEHLDTPHVSVARILADRTPKKMTSSIVRGTGRIGCDYVTLRGLMYDGIYVREEVDRDWQILITGRVVSFAGIYVIVQDVNGDVLHQGKVPPGEYATESPHIITVVRDGTVGDYLITILGSQPDYRNLRLPFTNLTREVYGGTTFSVSPAKRRPWTVVEPGELMFQVPEQNPEVTITRSDIPWTLHAADDSVVYDVREHGEQTKHPSNQRTLWVGTFTGTPGLTYRLGHTLHWFTVSPPMFLAIKADLWFEPDPRLRELKWWRYVP